MKDILILILFYFFVNHGSSAQEHTVISTNSETDLIPEGIAIDPKTGTIYISSINRHKIIAVDKNGKTKDFIKPDQDGFMEGLGLTVDTKRGWLWALSVLRQGNVFSSAIHAFDLKTGKTMQQYGIKDTLPHLFNDLVVAPDGNIFITDTYFSSVYKVNVETKKLDLFVQSALLRYPNGITFGNKGAYIATYKNGIVWLDTATAKIRKLPGATDTLVSHGLDGLVYHNNNLYGVYNTGKQQTDNCVIKYALSTDGQSITGEKLILKGVTDFADPTTATLLNGSLYIIANSHLDSFNANKQSTKGIEDILKPVTIIKYKRRGE